MTEPILYPDVELGEGAELQPGVIIGLPPRGAAAGLKTVIGPGARLRSHTVIYAGATIGAGFNSGHGAMIREDNLIGDGCSVGSHTVLEPGNRIGDRTRIHSQCFLEHVTLGARVFVGPGVVFTDDPHPMCPRYLDCVLGAVVADDVSIGGGATLLPGIKVGRGALIGAGSVVTRDVEEGWVVAGNPARRVKAVSQLACFKGYFERAYAWKEGAGVLP